MKIKQISVTVLAATLISFSLNVLAVESPTYNCTNEETQNYIKQVTFNLQMPSNIKTIEAFKKSYIEAKSKQTDDGSCVSIFTDGKLDEAWKDTVDSLRNLQLPSNPFSSLNGAMISSLWNEVKKKSQQAIADGIEALGADICSLMSTDYLEDKLLDGVNEKYNLHARELSVSEFAKELEDKGMDAVDDDVLLLLSERELKDKMTSETRAKIRKKRADLWDKF